jgi:hypothetical protein
MGVLPERLSLLTQAARGRNARGCHPFGLHGTVTPSWYECPRRTGAAHGGGAHIGPPHRQWAAVLSYWHFPESQSVSFTHVSAGVWQKYAT